MSDPKQNGAPKPPVIPEGDLYLLVRINPKTAEFQCVFSDMMSGIALHKLADTFLENIQRQMFAPTQITAAPLPGFDASMLAHFRKVPGN